jgi:hypothetical protein
MANSLSHSDVDIIQAIVSTFFGQSNARKFTASSITDETVVLIVKLLSEVEDCSTWIDAVPAPDDLLMPASKLRKWALRVIRNSGEPFLMGNVRVNMMCKRFRAAQFKPAIIDSLN